MDNLMQVQVYSVSQIMVFGKYEYVLWLNPPRWALAHGPRDHKMVKRVLKDSGVVEEVANQ